MTTPSFSGGGRSLESILESNQSSFIPVDRTDDSYLTSGESFDMSQLGRGGGQPLKIFPVAGQADHPIGGFSGHKDVIERLDTGEIVKFRLPYER
ncbi:MAG: hypothetical protein DWQ01_09815 [Planctomycetota bacterium]|nr:MAG: hypothetical protein DWQ01_09815 [Planctomycetota bacterium]